MGTGKVLIFGGLGLLGPYIRQAFESAGWQVVSSSRTSRDFPCDLTDPDSVRNLIERCSPNCVVNLAALANVDACENDPSAAMLQNAHTVENIVNALPKDAHFIQISTDQLYPDTPGPHAENAAAPVNMYGRSKLQGEEFALTHPNALVLRINLFGPSLTPGRQSLSDFYQKSFTEKTPIGLFEDSYFSPLHMGTIGEMICESAKNGYTGLYNMGSRAGMSKANFARALAAHFDLDVSCASPAKSSDIPSRAVRPKDMRMDVTRIERLLGRAMPALNEEIKKL